MTEHEEKVFMRLRKKMNNKNYKQWQDHLENNIPVDDSAQNYRIESTEWNAIPRWLQEVMRINER